MEEEIKKIEKPKKTKKWLLIVFIIAIFILFLSILLIVCLGTQRTDRGPYPYVKSDLTQIRIDAEVIFSEESSYENISCQPSGPYGEQIEPLCNDIEIRVGSKPIIHSTKDKYCAYAKTEKGDFWCIDSSLRSKQYDKEPSATCNDVSFSCE